MKQRLPPQRYLAKMPPIVNSIALYRPTYRKRIKRLFYRLIVVLLGHQKLRANHSDCVYGQDDPANGAQDKGLVEFPADEEAVIVVV